MIQRRWRGVLTRRRLLGMLHMHKWRRCGDVKLHSEPNVE